MLGKYADRRVYQHFVHTYSRVPYLDTEIFNLAERSKGLQRRADQRATSARLGLERITAMADQMEQSLKRKDTSKQEETPKADRKAEKELCETAGTSAKQKEEAVRERVVGTGSSALRLSYRRYGVNG